MNLSFIGDARSFGEIVLIIIDILVVTYVIYKILSTFQHTSTVSIIKGVVVICLINLSANFLNLNALKWMIQQATQVALVALVVVFQPELRKALERLGRGRFFNVALVKQPQDETKRIIENVIKAAFVMSFNKTGALIVFERETGTSNLTEIGVPINSDVSYELLMNIFIKNTPLHDGAVIIRENKISRAACVLPLSIRKSGGKKMGTRHRAALGITDETDAITLVVSEETGMVSLAMNGEFLSVHSEIEIRKVLSDELSSKSNFKWLFKRGEEK